MAFAEAGAEGESHMQIKVVVHEAEEGGFWAEVPAIPGCATQGDSMDELMRNLREAIAAISDFDRSCLGITLLGRCS
jgi:HicB_like antitoxin of bacterial toxin-antitoxin system